MKNSHLPTTLIAVVLAAKLIGAQAPAGRGGAAQPPAGRGGAAAINWNLIMFPTQRFADRDKEQKDPVKLFDNVYSVGDQTVCSFLITTSAGLVLIDTTFPETVDLVLDNIRKSGFDPANIKYVFPTHAAADHYGGSGRIKQVAPGARIGTSIEDWQSIEEQMSRPQPPGSTLLPFSRDLVISDGQTITLGDMTFKFYVLPGRTPGALGIEYQARDRGRRYRAMNTGAYGTPTEPRWNVPYLKSIARLKALGPWQVWLPNHPFMVVPRDLADIEKAMASRGQGPHPGVADPKQVDDQLDFIRELIGRKAAIEQYVVPAGTYRQGGR